MIGVHMVYDLGSLGLFVFKKWAQKADVWDSSGLWNGMDSNC